MCESCGCGDPHVVSVAVHERILSVNERQAAHNREHFASCGVLSVNLMGSPGAGKTAILEATARVLAGRRLAALAGDLATEYDALRLRKAGIASLSITTGSACHLDAAMVHDALHRLAWKDADYLFIENVGNLVCPAVYDLGQAVNVVALSVTEGEDKPLKYPVMFGKADLVLLTKADLLPYLGGPSIAGFREALARTMPAACLIPMSARFDQGIGPWVEWLEGRRLRRATRAPVAPAV